MKLFESLRRRWRLWRICRKLGIKPYPWQRDFALGLTGRLEYPPGRRTGTTTGVMLRVLMLENDADVCKVHEIMRQDPGYADASMRTLEWYNQEYLRMSLVCRMGPPVDFRFLAFRAAFCNPFRFGGAVLK